MIVILIFKYSPCCSLIVYNEGKMREISILPTQVLELSITGLFLYSQSLQYYCCESIISSLIVSITKVVH
jgi:hypothetical protein